MAYRGYAETSRARLERHGLSSQTPAQVNIKERPGQSSLRASERLKTLAAVSLSVMSSVSIVTCNKHLMSDLGFQQATTLTGWHTIACVLCMRVALALGWMDYKTCPRTAIMIFGFTQGISIGFLNLSLSFNSVGFYQMAKLAIIPFTVFVEISVYGKRYSMLSIGAIAVLLIGIGITTVTDVQLNLKGSILALLAIITTCLAQIWTGTTQKRYGLSSAQLLYHASPSMAVTLCLTGPVIDYMLTGSSVLSYQFTMASTAFIIASCSIAVAVNMATFLVIGRCDAVTYQVLGHLKTVMVLTYGLLRMSTMPSSRNLLGIAVAMVGMVAYGVAKEREKQLIDAKSVLPSTSPMKGGRPVTPIKSQ